MGFQDKFHSIVSFLEIIRLPRQSITVNDITTAWVEKRNYGLRTNQTRKGMKMGIIKEDNIFCDLCDMEIDRIENQWLK